MQTDCVEQDNARVFRGANHQNPAGANKGAFFESIRVAAAGESADEAGLPGRVDRATIACRSCGCETTSSDRICPRCVDERREERAAGLDEQCRGRRVEDLPVSELDEMQRGRC